MWHESIFASHSPLIFMYTTPIQKIRLKGKVFGMKVEARRGRVSKGFIAVLSSLAAAVIFSPFLNIKGSSTLHAPDPENHKKSIETTAAKEPESFVRISDVVKAVNNQPLLLINEEAGDSVNAVRMGYAISAAGQVKAETTQLPTASRAKFKISDHIADEAPLVLSERTRDEILALRLQMQLDALAKNSKPEAERTNKAPKPVAAANAKSKNAEKDHHTKSVAAQKAIEKAEEHAEIVVAKRETEFKELVQKPLPQKIYNAFDMIETLTGIKKETLVQVCFDESRLGMGSSKKNKNIKKNYMEVQNATIIDYIKWRGEEAAQILDSRKSVTVDGKDYKKFAADLDFLGKKLSSGGKLTNSQRDVIKKTIQEDVFLTGLLSALQMRNAQGKLTEIVQDQPLPAKEKMELTKAAVKFQHTMGDQGAENMFKSNPWAPVSSVMSAADFNNFPYVSRSDTVGSARLKIATTFNKSAKTIGAYFEEQPKPVRENKKSVKLVPAPTAPGYIKLAYARAVSNNKLGRN